MSFYRFFDFLQPDIFGMICGRSSMLIVMNYLTLFSCCLYQKFENFHQSRAVGQSMKTSSMIWLNM